MAESSGGVPENWGRLDGELGRFEIGGLTDLGEMGWIGEVKKVKLKTKRVQVEGRGKTFCEKVAQGHVLPFGQAN